MPGGEQNAKTGPRREGRKKDARGASMRGVLLPAGSRGVRGAGGRGEPIPNVSASGKDGPGTRGGRKGRKQWQGGFSRSGEEVTHGGKLHARPGASSQRRCQGRCGHTKVPPGDVPCPVGDKPQPPNLPIQNQEQSCFPSNTSVRFWDQASRGAGGCAAIWFGKGHSSLSPAAPPPR